MTDGDALLRGVIGSSDDDGPRLVYADWLEERGQHERAAFIRAQCELARLPFDDPRASELEARALRLLARHAREWQGPGCQTARFHRGFVEELYWCNPSGAAEYVVSLFARHPVRDVEFCGQPDPGWGRPLAARPELARVETLRLTHSRSGWLQFDDVLALLRSPHLTGVTALDLSGGDGGHRYGHRRFLEIIRPRRGKLVPALRGLRKLSLNGLNLTDESVRALVESPLAATLTHLDLSNNGWSAQDAGVTVSGLRALVESPLWRRLEELNLGGLRFQSPTAARLVVRALPASRIGRLGVGALVGTADGGDVVAEALASARSWGRLRELNVSWNRTDADAVGRLVGHPGMAALTRLDCRGICLDDGGVAALAAAPGAANLRKLWVEDYAGRVTGPALEALAASPHVTRLVSLACDCAGIGDHAVATFARSANAARLRWWTLPHTVGETALEAIARSPNCRSLVRLFAGPWQMPGDSQRVTASVAEAPAGSAGLPHLAVFGGSQFETLSPECPPDHFFPWSKDAD